MAGKVEYECEHCGSKFMQYASQMGRRTFCSKPCYWEGMRGQVPHNAGKRTVAEKPCAQCGKVISGMPSEVNRRKFCSSRCAGDSFQKDVEDVLRQYTVEGECWVWTGATRGGYGRVKLSTLGQTVSTHRLSYEHHVGPIPDGKVLDHLCRNRACMNPAHLEPVTHQENIRRGEAGKRKQTEREKARRAAALRKHYSDPENRAKRTEVMKRAWVTRRARAENASNRGRLG